jgi:hypothetical protein
MHFVGFERFLLVVIGCDPRFPWCRGLIGGFVVVTLLGCRIVSIGCRRLRLSLGLRSLAASKIAFVLSPSRWGFFTVARGQQIPVREFSRQVCLCSAEVLFMVTGPRVSRPKDLLGFARRTLRHKRTNTP